MLLDLDLVNIHHCHFFRVISHRMHAREVFLLSHQVSNGSISFWIFNDVLFLLFPSSYCICLRFRPKYQR